MKLGNKLHSRLKDEKSGLKDPKMGRIWQQNKVYEETWLYSVYYDNSDDDWDNIDY